MPRKISTQSLAIALVIALMVIVTRGHHFASIDFLPSASYAAFFIAGYYLRSTIMFVALLALCAGLDLAAVTWGGVSNFCVTPAYGFLLPAYGTMWLAGRWTADNTSWEFSSLFKLAGVVVMASAIAELFSSGGFYFFGGRYENPTLIEFGARVVKYYPKQLEAIAFWVVVALIAHVVFGLAKRSVHEKA
jgi:hypothetical protein